MMKESTKKVAGWEPKSPLKGGKHHDFSGIGCWNVLLGGRLPLKHNVIREKVILN
jgi:hypothetical protein